jgi:hypothetical protein
MVLQPPEIHSPVHPKLRFFYFLFTAPHILYLLWELEEPRAIIGNQRHGALDKLSRAGQADGVAQHGPQRRNNECSGVLRPHLGQEICDSRTLRHNDITKALTKPVPSNPNVACFPWGKAGRNCSLK